MHLKAEHLARNPDQGTAAASDWTYHCIVFEVGKTLLAILIGELLFSLVKSIVRSSDWLKLIWSENFLTKFFIE